MQKLELTVADLRRLRHSKEEIDQNKCTVRECVFDRVAVRRNLDRLDVPWNQILIVEVVQVLREILPFEVGSMGAFP